MADTPILVIDNDPEHARQICDILTYLARHRSGVTAAQMSTHLFGVDDRTVTVRRRDGENLPPMPIGEFAAKIAEEVRTGRGY